MAKVEFDGNLFTVTFTKAEISKAGGGGGGGKRFPEKGPQPPLNPNGTPRCPVCHGEMVERSGTSKTGNPYHFWSCKDFKICATVLNAPLSERYCPDCGRMMNLREGQKGPYFSCSGYQTTDKTKNVIRPTLCKKMVFPPKPKPPEPKVEVDLFSEQVDDDPGFTDDVPF